MSFSPSMIAGIAQGAIGLGTTLFAGSKLKKAEEEAARLQKERPNYAITPESQFEQSLAESELANGMSAEAEAAYENSAERDIAASLDAMLKTGGSSGNIADIFSASNESRQKLALLKDQLRLRQVGNVVDAYRNMTEQRDKEFQVNKDAPWKDAAQANADARKAAAALQMQGFNTFAGGGANYLSGMSDQNTYTDFWKPKPRNTTFPTRANFNLNNSNDLFALPNDITGQVNNSAWLDSIGGGSQGWYR